MPSSFSSASLQKFTFAKGLGEYFSTVKFTVSGTFEAPRIFLPSSAFSRVDLPAFMTPVAATLNSSSCAFCLAFAAAFATCAPGFSDKIRSQISFSASIF